MSKIQVGIDEVETLLNRLGEINAPSFEDIEWTRNGEPVKVPLTIAAEWRFLGMSNAAFVEFFGDRCRP